MMKINKLIFFFIPSGDDVSKADIKSNTDTATTTTTTATPSTTAVKLESSSTTTTNNSTLTTSTSVADANDSCIGGTGNNNIVTNGTTCNAASSPSSNLLNNNNKNEKGLPKAMVKPNVLTHVIGDFVIQEANEPFPLTRQRYPDDAADEPPSEFCFRFFFHSFFFIGFAAVLNIITPTVTDTLCEIIPYLCFIM